MLIDRLQKRFEAQSPQLVPASGGCIHQTHILTDGDRRMAFVKAAPLADAPLLECEATALEKLAESNAIRVPRVLALDLSAEPAYLALEALAMRPLAGANAWKQLGTGLRKLHGVHHKQFGWHEDNFIGSTPQANRWEKSWPEFFIRHRLQAQFAIAAEDGHTFPNTDEVLEASRALLASHNPTPSLLHGDLWSGNVAMLEDEQPVIFDPASYYGDPMVDLAMLELFGPTLPPPFWEGYGPPAQNREQTRPVHDLYHYLNHLHIFGSSYRPAVESRMKQILSAPPATC